ncbi:kinase-like domain-containing protein [Lipomyces oligophaga]|uniref:kinase-like domain-containing protein n=1 Tax=Lipomyces oligophaga TaxID=45792 RepID=UPI0034CEC12A
MNHQEDKNNIITLSGNSIDVGLYAKFLGKTFAATRFKKLGKLGGGSSRAEDLETKEIVAIKLAKISESDKRDGVPVTALRELTILQTLRHKNVVSVLGVAVGVPTIDNIYMVLEYVEHDLANLLDFAHASFTASEVKCLMKQLFQGLAYIHDRGIIHRDIKMANLLLSSRGILKIADFGLARDYTNHGRALTPGVVTIWYRSPELLFGEKHYTSAIDIWSSGCIMGELILRKPLVPGKTEISQMNCIVDLLGPPTDKIWPGFRKLPYSKSFKFNGMKFNQLDRVFSGQRKDLVDMINDLLTYDPTKRITALKALEHHYFKQHPLAVDPVLLPTFPNVSNSDNSEIDQHRKKKVKTEKYSFEIDEKEALSVYKN